jgi:hypothetical protein
VNPRDHSLERWVEGEAATFRSLLLTADVAAEALRRGPEAMRASADQLRAVVDAGQQRGGTHPCPDPAFGVRLAGLLERYGFMARSLEAPVDDYGDGYIPAVANQLQRLGTEFALFVKDLGRAVGGR